MDTRSILKIFIPAITITVLVCGGIYLYAQRDLNQFIESLGEPPAVTQPRTTQERTTEEPISEVTPSTASDARSLEHDTHEDPALTDNPLFSREHEHGHDGHTHDDHGHAHEMDLSQEEGFNEDAADDLSDTQQQSVPEGFNEYNTYLSSDPERAYARLAQALRDRYGDHPEMDEFVETVRQANEGTLTKTHPLAKKVHTVKRVLKV